MDKISRAFFSFPKPKQRSFSVKFTMKVDDKLSGQLLRLFINMNLRNLFNGNVIIK